MSLKKNIDLFIEKINAATFVSRARNYLGASIIGHHCCRFIWLEYNNQDDTILDAKTNRIFSIGKMYEDVVANEINLLVKNKVIKDIKYQIEYQNDIIKGTADAVMTFNDNKKILIEIKTMNDASFKNLIKSNIFSAMQIYFNQCQAYMGLSKIPNCLVLVVNKNTSQYYHERLIFNKQVFHGLIEKAKFVINRKSAPFGHTIGTNKYFRCNMCKYVDDCWGNNGSSLKYIKN